MRESEEHVTGSFGAIHRFDDSGRAASYLLESPNGAHLKLSDRARIVLEMRWAGETFESIADRLRDLHFADATSEAVATFFGMLDDKIRKADADVSRATPMFTVRFPMLPEKLVEALARPLGIFYQPIVAAIITVGLISASVAAFMMVPLRHGIRPSVSDVAFAYLLYLASLLIHELGHASATSKYGATPSSIGFTMYLVFPALYSDVTNAWKLRRWQRVVVDLGGTYFQFIAAAIYLALFSQTHNISYKMAIFAILGTSLFNLNPLFKFDGYWIVSDALGISNLSKQPARLVRSMYAALRPGKASQTESLPWPRWVLICLGVYSICAVAAWCYFLTRLATSLTSNAATALAKISGLLSRSHPISPAEVVSAAWSISLIVIAILALCNILRSSSLLTMAPRLFRKPRV